VIYRFTGGASDGTNPGNGDLVFDQAGNIYGTTLLGGFSGYGVVFEMVPSNGSWAESVLHSFIGNQGDGAYPDSGVIFDNAGNLYGTTTEGGGGGNGGTVFQLIPSGSGWTEDTLYQFGQVHGDGCHPSAGLIFDQSGNLYGTTPEGCVYGYGTVFELTQSSGNWMGDRTLCLQWRQRRGFSQWRANYGRRGQSLWHSVPRRSGWEWFGF
jgi:hypothetical protein